MIWFFWSVAVAWYFIKDAYTLIGVVTVLAVIYFAAKFTLLKASVRDMLQKSSGEKK